MQDGQLTYKYPERPGGLGPRQRAWCDARFPNLRSGADRQAATFQNVGERAKAGAEEADR